MPKISRKKKGGPPARRKRHAAAKKAETKERPAVIFERDEKNGRSGKKNLLDTLSLKAGVFAAKIGRSCNNKQRFS